MRKRLLLVLGLNLLTACSWYGGDDSVKEPELTLAQLQPARVPEKSDALPSVNLDELIAIYQEAQAVSRDPRIQLQVQRRLADLQLIRGEQRMEVANEKGLFDLAIAAYSQVLTEAPENPDSDNVKYQLSKAYDLSGQSAKSLEMLESISEENPQFSQLAEVEFRKGEAYFSQGRYDKAEAAYARVIAIGDITPYYQNALYMHGWSQFKRGRYRAAIPSFTETLDRLVPPNSNLDVLSRGERELVDDTLRALSVVFSYLDGPKTIQEVYSRFGERHYMGLLYAGLGELYLSQERYHDSAETFIAYTNRYPGADDAHSFYARVIETYRLAGFPEQVLKQKQAYVKRFGVRTSYWQLASPLAQNKMDKNLRKFISELATHFHALAQQERDAATKPSSDKKAAGANKGSVEKNHEYYKLAGDYYLDYVESFPLDERTPEMAYLLGDTRVEAGDFAAAVDAYSMVAYDLVNSPKAAEAGYAAIVTYDRMPPAESQVAQNERMREKIAGELRFANAFSDDPRAVAVQLDAAKTLLELEDYASALDAAQGLINWPQDTKPQGAKPDSETLIAAWLVVGHSQFALQDYLQAENAYRQALNLMPDSDKRRVETVDRVAASIYKQAEFLLAAGDEAGAADEFYRVVETAPGSSYRANAQYDAATHYMAAGQANRAINLLTDFRQRFPNNELTAGIALKLAKAYQDTENWSAAGEELQRISTNDSDPDTRRQALYQSAELYAKAGDRQRALETYRKYVNTYPQPFDINLETMATLSAMYEEQNDQGKRRFWLQRMIDADAKAGSARSDRSKYLAAQASAVFADDAYNRFAAIKLTLPIKRSLATKKKALNDVLAAYKRTNAYGIEEFATLSGYRIGEIYRQLSQDLMASERPDGLDELAMEQYEVLLEEQAYPFEEKAIDIHEKNAQRSWSGVYDQWVKDSFSVLAKMLPARYGKVESVSRIAEEIY